MKRLANKGFTLVELMIATAVFSVVLLLITNGMIEVGRLFFKGSTNYNTQEVARTILEDMSQAIQFGGEQAYVPPASYPAGSQQRVCIGTRRYSFVTNTVLTASNHVMMVDRLSGVNCSSSTTPDLSSRPGAREMLGRNMRISHLEVTRDAATETYFLRIRVLYGETSVLEDSYLANGTPGTDGVLDSCRNDRSNSQFCSASELSTTVKRRLQ